jgi:phage-related protein
MLGDDLYGLDPRLEDLMTLNAHKRMHKVMQIVQTVQKEQKKDMKYAIVTHDYVTELVRPVTMRFRILYYPIIDKVDITEGTYTTKAGKTNSTCRVTVVGRLRFVNIDDPTDFYDVGMVGQGVDESDKGSGKAMSYAVKMGVLKGLALETGMDSDLEQEARFDTFLGTNREPTEDIQRRGDEFARSAEKAFKEPEGSLEPKMSSYAMKKNSPEEWPTFEKEMRATTSSKEAQAVWATWRQRVNLWPDSWATMAREEEYVEMWNKHKAREKTLKENQPQRAYKERSDLPYVENSGDSN